MLVVTFYSYKGGVGRSLAMLNVAAIIAGDGKRVLAIDLDLEAPGFGLSAATTPPSNNQSGVSDYILGRIEGNSSALDEYYFRLSRSDSDGELWLMPTGCRALELASEITRLISDPESESAYAFQLLRAEIETKLAPDYVFIDSRTGLADIAGICTLELPDALVLVAGLNDQNVNGMSDVIENVLRYETEAKREIGKLLVLSPVPRVEDIRSPPLAGSTPMVRDDRLLRKLFRAQEKLLRPIFENYPAVRRQFPRLGTHDLFHELTYDPLLPLADSEILDHSTTTIFAEYEGLAASVSRLSKRHEYKPRNKLKRPSLHISL